MTSNFTKKELKVQLQNLDKRLARLTTSDADRIERQRLTTLRTQLVKELEAAKD